jgi:hydrogenase maturation protease
MSADGPVYPADPPPVPASPLALIDLLGVEATRPGPALLVIGCGNPLRGDDAVGPAIVRHLWDRGVADAGPPVRWKEAADAGPGVGGLVELADGGTSGMDVAFRLRGAGRVILVDAARTGLRPGTVVRVSGAGVAEFPPMGGLASHEFRWNHALAFGRWLLGDQMPGDIDVVLIEGESFEFGAPLSEPARTALAQVISLIEAEIDAVAGVREEAAVDSEGPDSADAG